MRHGPSHKFSEREGRIKAVMEFNGYHIVWLLEEAQKPVEVSQSGEESRIAKEILIEETITEYRLAHNTSWYKDIKKLEDIIGKKDSFVWTMEDQNPEIVIP
ncbi:hypothetical protein RhiirC2_708891 [Rhizophagus irregularis]|uniref:Uncharacterized protein n=1 Tax=Rhizophagus irregularis TaxID=588596 RepID=A0A2N1NKM1_9GLOM|nr:hypothetical protein RhiirC2_708891 [Rhizophagus irregularis]